MLYTACVILSTSYYVARQLPTVHVGRESVWQLVDVDKVSVGNYDDYVVD